MTENENLSDVIMLVSDIRHKYASDFKVLKEYIQLFSGSYSIPTR